jgi:Uma2 family endonuclease
MVALPLVPLEEYEHTAYEPDMEYANGILIGRNVGTQLHGLLQTIISAYLHQLRKTFGFVVFTETRLRLSTSRHVVPDVMIVERPYLRGKTVTDVPAVVFEIKSPDDTLDDLFDKCLEYAALGVENIVVLDPDPTHRRQYIFTADALRLVGTEIVLRLPKSDGNLHFPVGAMFAELDEETQ